jgi:hypothetical protein
MCRFLHVRAPRFTLSRTAPREIQEFPDGTDHALDPATHPLNDTFDA